MTQKAANLLDISSLDLRQLRGLYKLTLREVLAEINRRGRVKGVSEPWLSEVERGKRVSPRRRLMIRKAILRLAAREVRPEEEAA